MRGLSLNRLTTEPSKYHNNIIPFCFCLSFCITFLTQIKLFASNLESDGEADEDHRDVIEHHDDIIEHAFEVDIRAVIGIEQRGIGDHEERKREQHCDVEVAAERDEAVERAEERHRDQSSVDDHDDAVLVEGDDVHAVEQQYSERNNHKEGQKPEVELADIGDHCRRKQDLRRAEEEDAAQHKANCEFFFEQFFEHQHDVAGGAEHQARQHDCGVAQVFGVGKGGENADQHKADRRGELENARPNAFFVDVKRARGDCADEDVGAERIDPPTVHVFPPVGSNAKLPCLNTGTTEPSCLIPSMFKSRVPIMKSTCSFEEFAPRAISSSLVM